MNTNALLDALKEKTGAPSDYQLARRVLKCDPISVKEMRERGFSEERALQVATLLELDPAEVLASIRAERAKSPEVRAVWQRIAESMRSALGMVCGAAIVLALIGAPAPSQAAQAATYHGIHYAQSRRRRARRWALLRLPQVLPPFEAIPGLLADLLGPRPPRTA